MLVSVLLKELTEAYMVIEMLLAQQREKRKDRHKLKHDNLTVPTQLVPARALWCHLQRYCHWGISLPRKMRSNQSKRNGSSSHSTVPLADDNLTVRCAPSLLRAQAHWHSVCTKPPPGSAQGAGRAGWLWPAVAGQAGITYGAGSIQAAGLAVGCRSLSFLWTGVRVAWFGTALNGWPFQFCFLFGAFGKAIERTLGVSASAVSSSFKRHCFYLALLPKLGTGLSFLPCTRQ